MRAGPLFRFFGGYRESLLNVQFYMELLKILQYVGISGKIYKVPILFELYRDLSLH